MSYLKGIYKKAIYNSSDGYIVGLIRVKENDIDELLNDQTITFTGSFGELNIDDNVLLNGSFQIHNRYGEQFNVKSYEILLPDEKSSIVKFLSSDIFKGIGSSKALKIYDHFGEKTLDIILNEPSKLLEISLNKKDIDTLYNKLLEYNENIDVMLKLSELGFNPKDSNLLYKKYKCDIPTIIEENIYKFYLENEEISFRKVDNIALKLNYERNDIRRVCTSIVFVLDEVCNNNGNSYLNYEEIFVYLNEALGIYIDYGVLDDAIRILESNKDIIIDEDRYYLKKMYDAENNICNRFVYLNNKKDSKYKNLSNYIDDVQNIYNINYDNIQSLAIKSSFIKNFLIITGGPGTGKTTIVKSIVELYKNVNTGDDNGLVLLAPTGRASKRLMESSGYPAQTIHRFLKWNKDNNRFGINERNKSDAKMVIIDEASMIDTYLMNSLLNGLKYDTKIVLVGDYNQLPSVGSGQVLKDLIESEKFTVIKLEKLYRQAENSNIITLAYDINSGINDANYYNKSDDLTYIEANSYNLKDELKKICIIYKYDNYNDFQIMAPMYKTVNGIDSLNVFVQNIFNPQDSDKNEMVINEVLYRENDKVLQLVNMPDDNVYNGDIGIIKRIDNLKKEVYIDYDNNIVKYNKSNFHTFKLGYVISIHKSQGSEFKTVVVPLLTEYNRMLYRKLFYTAVTRAKNRLYIIGEINAIKVSILNDRVDSRKTTLKNMINKMYLNKSIVE